MKEITSAQVASVAGAAFIGKRDLEPFGANWSHKEELLACLRAKKLIEKEWKKSVPSQLVKTINFLVSRTLRNKMSSEIKDNSFILVPKGEYKTIRRSFDKGCNAGGHGVYVEWIEGKPFIVKDTTHHTSCGMPYSGGYKKYPLKTNKQGSVLVSTRHYA